MGIPKYPDFVKLGMEHREEVEEWLSNYPPVISEYTFTNLFIWKGRGGYELSIYKGFLVIIMAPSDRKDFVMPPVGEGDLADCAQAALDYLGRREIRPTLERVPLATATELANAGFAIMHDPLNDDYLYEAGPLIKLEEEKYSGIKSKMDRLSKSFDIEYRPLDEKLVERCLRIERSWLDVKHAEHIPELAKEANAIRTALLNFGELNYKGGVLLVNGMLDGFALGEELNPDTAVIHIEKSNHNRAGAAEALGTMFVENEWSGYKYINREQDLGSDELRNFKQGYFPVKMVEKYVVRSKG
jgi:hypothetical protein